MIKKRNLVVANWKMNPSNLDESKHIFNNTKNFARNLRYVDVVVCPPYPYLQLLSKIKAPKNLFLGAQNVSSEDKTAFTGEVSVEMVKDLSVAYVIVGHSERRAMGESNEIVAKKLDKVFRNGLIPILCIGERERNHDGRHLEFIKNQLKECLSKIQKSDLVGLLLAYEPIWAIGKSYRESMNATDVHEVTLFIQKVLGELFGRDIASSVRILYGGSVEAENAQDIIFKGNIDGFLVGHASLMKEQFNLIMKSADFRR